MNGFFEIFPKLSALFPKTIKGIVWAGMSIVNIYHLFMHTPYFNVTFEEAHGIEKFADVLLTPVQYLCEGKVASYDPESQTYILKQRFDYQTNKRIYSPFSLFSFSSSLLFGSVVKAYAFIFPQTRHRYNELKLQMENKVPTPLNDYYRSIGIQVENFEKTEWIDPPKHSRRSGDENHLKEDKEALKAIAKLLIKHEIPFWVDCGTCLGAYRYGGIIPWDNDLDLAVIADDHENVWLTLKKLDRAKYVVQDWSNRGRPGTYIRVYIKSNRNHIDIYHNAIDPINQTLTYIISQEPSVFLPDSWKIHERMFGKPVPFDMIFPLKKASFDGIEVPVPNQTALYLSYKYGPNIEPAMVYNSKTERYEKDLSHPYWLIPLSH